MGGDNFAGRGNGFQNSGGSSNTGRRGGSGNRGGGSQGGRGGNKRPDTGYGAPRFSRATDVSEADEKDVKKQFFEWLKQINEKKAQENKDEDYYTDEY